MTNRMPNNDFPDPVPSDRLGRMLVLSMVFHVALFGGLVWYNARTSKFKPLVPTYTVDLVNMPLPSPGPKTALPESPPPGPVAIPGGEFREKSGPVAPALEPKKTEAAKHHLVEQKPVVQVKPVPPTSPPHAKHPPAQPQHPKVAVPPLQVAAKPVPSAPKRIEPPTPAPAIKPAPAPKKVVAPKAVAEPKAPAEPVKKPVPEAAAPSAESARDKARERQIAQEITTSQKKLAESSRNQTINESIQDLEKSLAAKSRDRAYKDAVGQAAARLSAGKVSTKVSQASGGEGCGTGGGSMGSAQTAAYGAQVSLTVRRHWQPNCLQRSNMQNLKAVIIVRIQADGAISAAWFEKESGDRLFDQSAMTAVTRSSPLPALPPGQEKLEIGITFTPEWKASS
jgi:TonB family protein